MGRPRTIESPEEMDRLVDEYVESRRELVAETGLPHPITLTGLILYMGLSSRQSLDQYAQYEGFNDSVKRAKLTVESQYEENLHGQSASGSIFALKNMGWTDRQELTHGGRIDSNHPLSELEIANRLAAMAAAGHSRDEAGSGEAGEDGGSVGSPAGTADEGS